MYLKDASHKLTHISCEINSASTKECNIILYWDKWSDWSEVKLQCLSEFVA